MDKILFGFLKGLVIGVLLLPLEFVILLSSNQTVLAQENLRDQIRSQVADPREIRSQISDPRDSVVKPCEQDPREGCARPVPRPSPSPEPQVSPSPAPSVAPSAAPSPSTGPQVSPSPVSPSASPGVGGNPASPTPSSCPSCQETSVVGGETTVTIIQRPQVLGLSFTGSGKW